MSATFPQIAAAMGVDAVARQGGAMPAARLRSGRAHDSAQARLTRLSVTDAAGHIRKFEELESEIIRMAISRYEGHMSEVARRLGIGRSTLYRKLKEFGLEPEGDAAHGDACDPGAPDPQGSLIGDSFGPRVSACPARSDRDREWLPVPGSRPCRVFASGPPGA